MATKIFGFECEACDDITLWAFVVVIQLCLIGFLLLLNVIFTGVTYTKMATSIDEMKVPTEENDSPRPRPPDWRGLSIASNGA